jgi:hypothetical protein
LEDFLCEVANLHPVELALKAVRVIERVCPGDTRRLGHNKLSFPAISCKLLVPPAPSSCPGPKMDIVEKERFADQRYVENFWVRERQHDEGIHITVRISIDLVIQNHIVLGEEEANGVVYFGDVQFNT